MKWIAMLLLLCAAGCGGSSGTVQYERDGVTSEAPSWMTNDLQRLDRIEDSQDRALEN